MSKIGGGSKDMQEQKSTKVCKRHRPDDRGWSHMCLTWTWNAIPGNVLRSRVLQSSHLRPLFVWSSWFSGRKIWVLGGLWYVQKRINLNIQLLNNPNEIQVPWTILWLFFFCWSLWTYQVRKALLQLLMVWAAHGRCEEVAGKVTDRQT